MASRRELIQILLSEMALDIALARNEETMAVHTPASYGHLASSLELDELILVFDLFPVFPRHAEFRSLICDHLS